MTFLAPFPTGNVVFDAALTPYFVRRVFPRLAAVVFFGASVGPVKFPKKRDHGYQPVSLNCLSATPCVIRVLCYDHGKFADAGIYP